MTRSQWERTTERWDRWYADTLADLRQRAAAGEDYARRVLHRYDVLTYGRPGLHPVKPLPGRTALNRALRETPKEG